MASNPADVVEEKAQIETVGLPTYKEAVKINKSFPSKKKWVIGGIVTVVVVAMVIGGALLGLYLQNKQTLDLVREVTINTKDGKELIRVDPGKGEEEYELPDKQFRVLHDFKKGFSVFRMKLNNTMACYLKPLNETKRLSPEALSSYLRSGGYEEEPGEEPGEDSDSGPTGLVASDTHVRDPSFLSDRARDMCDGLFFYWLLPAEPKEEGQTQTEHPGHRVKRSGCYYYYQDVTLCWYEYIKYSWGTRIRLICIRVVLRYIRCD